MKLYIRYLFVIIVFAALQTSCEKQENATSSTTTTGAGGSMARFAIKGDYMYIVDNSALDVYDISNPAIPVFKSTQDIGFNIETIYPYKDKLFIGSTNGMYVYNLNTPDKPIKEGSVTHVRACDPVVANDTVAYVTLRQGTTCGGNQNFLNIYDLKNGANPVLTKAVALTSPPFGLGIRQNALYVCEAAGGLVIFDLTDPFSPKKIKEITGDAYYDVIPYNNVLIAYIDKGVVFFDITDPLDIVKAGAVRD